jgi:hypothetical protein
MSASNSRFPRGLRVLITMAVLAILIWLFAANTPYYYYSIGAAALITAVVSYLTYRKPPTAQKRREKNLEEGPEASEEDLAKAELESDSLKPGDIVAKEPSGNVIRPENVPLKIDDEENGESPIPLIEDPSDLTLDEKNLLVNAVWYRCENPYCKFTSFLSVHHLVEGKDNGANKLENLIVLCPYCHDLAHRGEIPEKEMREWISDRQERWKFKPDWKYF